MPHNSSVPLKWRLQKNRYMLIGTRCAKCNENYFPPRLFCPECGNSCEEKMFSGEGSIESFTHIHAAPTGFENHVPYTVGLVRLNDGPVVAAQITGSKNIAIGAPVRAIFRRIGESTEDGVINYGFKFECE